MWEQTGVTHIHVCISPTFSSHASPFLWNTDSVCVYCLYCLYTNLQHRGEQKINFINTQTNTLDFLLCVHLLDQTTGYVTPRKRQLIRKIPDRAENKKFMCDSKKHSLSNESVCEMWPCTLLMRSNETKVSEASHLCSTHSIEKLDIKMRLMAFSVKASLN